MLVERIVGNGTFAALYGAIFQMPSFLQILEVLWDFLASAHLETVQLPAFSMLFAMFTEVCGPPEKLSLTRVACSNVLCMIVKFP